MITYQVGDRIRLARSIKDVALAGHEGQIVTELSAPSGWQRFEVLLVGIEDKVIVFNDEIELTGPQDIPEPSPPTVFPLATLDLLGWKFTVSKGQLLLETAPINGTPGIMYLGRGSLEALRAVLELALAEPEYPPEEEHLMYGRLIQDGTLGVAR